MYFILVIHQDYWLICRKKTHPALFIFVPVPQDILVQWGSTSIPTEQFDSAVLPKGPLKWTISTDDCKEQSSAGVPGESDRYAGFRVPLRASVGYLQNFISWITNFSYSFFNGKIYVCVSFLISRIFWHMPDINFTGTTHAMLISY